MFNTGWWKCLSELQKKLIQGGSARVSKFAELTKHVDWQNCKHIIHPVLGSLMIPVCEAAPSYPNCEG